MTDWFALLCDAGSVGDEFDPPESVVARAGHIAGVEVVVIVCDFEFLAGTLSVAAGASFVRAVDIAIERGVAVVAVARSGGARMQQGTRAFVQMLRAMDAVARLRWVGLPLIVYLADPTTGGVFASWASAGHVTFAEPGATVAFTGPRIAAALGASGEPADVQRSEALFEHGHVDRVVPIDELRDAVACVVRTLTPADAPVVRDIPGDHVDGPRGWRAVTAARQLTGPQVLDRVLARADEVTVLEGDRAGTRTDTVVAAICRLDGRPLVVIGHRKGSGAVGSAGLRVARRAMAVAVDLGLPIVTVIDTEGAEISSLEEESGLAGAISASMATMLAAPVSTVSILAGSGSGGAAIAWAGADRLLAVPEAWMAPISPEAASLIVHRTQDRASEMADMQRVGAIELLEAGIVDRLITPDRIVDAISTELDALAATATDELLARRSERIGCLGE